MAYNILAESKEKISWEELNKKLFKNDMLIEFIPMPKLGICGGDALGISIPSKNANKKAWEELKKIIYILINDYKFELYDMYYGVKIDDSNLDRIKNNIIS